MGRWCQALAWASTRAVLDGHVSGQAWTVVIPVKSLAHAKSRLGAASPPPSTLARAFLADVLASALACPTVREVIVATGDPDAAILSRACGARVVDDTGHDGINAAVTAAALQADRTTRIAVVVSDLPRLTASALEQVLAAGLGHPTSFVADRAGTGTTMWLAASASLMPPAFGEGSRQRHRSSGAVDLVETLGPEFSAQTMAARCDVDTQADLAAPDLPPLGRHTRALLEPTAADPGA